MYAHVLWCTRHSCCSRIKKRQNFRWYMYMYQYQYVCMRILTRMCTYMCLLIVLSNQLNSENYVHACMYALMLDQHKIYMHSTVYAYVHAHTRLYRQYGNITNMVRLRYMTYSRAELFPPFTWHFKKLNLETQKTIPRSFWPFKITGLCTALCTWHDIRPKTST